VTLLLFLQTADSLCSFYVRLKELGHPTYLDKNFEDKLKCSVEVCVAEEKVYCVIEPKYVLFINLTDCW